MVVFIEITFLTGELDGRTDGILEKKVSMTPATKK